MQVKSFEEYQQAYSLSVNQPEEFWAGIANNFLWKKKWDKVLEWEFEETELDFLRLFVKSDDSFASNPILAVAAVRLLYVVPGWSFLPMLDLKGHETKCGLLVRWEMETV